MRGQLIINDTLLASEHSAANNGEGLAAAAAAAAAAGIGIAKERATRL